MLGSSIASFTLWISSHLHDGETGALGASHLPAIGVCCGVMWVAPGGVLFSPFSLEQ